MHVIESTHNEFHDTSNATTNSSTTTDEMNLLTNHLDQDDESTHETDEHHENLKHRQNTLMHNGSYSAATVNHEHSLSTDSQHSTTTTTTVTKPSSSTTFTSNNRKGTLDKVNESRKLPMTFFVVVLAKSTKDLQRQTSTLTNVELSFENEIKSSIKRIDDVFKQIREIIKEREIELYLEMDQVKEQGLNMIHRRKHRAMELRQRIDCCDRMEPSEIDHLRTDVKQFVTERRYDLGEELTSSHRFEYDPMLIESLKHFGTVLRIDRKHDRARTLSTSSALIEQNGTTTTTTNNHTDEKSVEHTQPPTTNGRVPTSSSSSSNELLSPNHQQPLPQRINHKQNFNRNTAGDHYQNSHAAAPPNGYSHSYDDDANNYQPGKKVILLKLFPCTIFFTLAFSCQSSSTTTTAAATTLSAVSEWKYSSTTCNATVELQ